MASYSSYALGVTASLEDCVWVAWIVWGDVHDSCHLFLYCSGYRGWKHKMKLSLEHCKCGQCTVDKTRSYLTIMYGVYLFVCLFSIQIGAATRFAVKRAMPAEGCLGRILRGPACNYLPCGRRTCEVFLGRGTETPFSINVMRSPIAGRNALKRSKTYHWGKPQAVLLGDRHATIYLSCGHEDSPRYFRPADRDAILRVSPNHHCRCAGACAPAHRSPPLAGFYASALDACNMSNLDKNAGLKLPGRNVCNS